ncbi:hypothetical protein SAMN02787144_1006142 [Streptomyces atratus]|uniref:Uncharacterized protein n=1 Tax=Streptomyces atratus TaxID=1893 RepID=A0A1K1ZWL1_STRAR|nr:hypothetical protein SAMN02787144_1006142 [Streptomyces atratus]
MGEVLKPNCGYNAHSGRQHGQGDAQSAARRSRQGVGHADIVVPAFTWLPLVVDKRTTWQHPRRTPGAARIRFVAQRGSSPSPQRWRRHRAEHGSSAPANRAPPSVADSWTALMPLRCRRLHSWYISLAVRDWAIRSAVCSSASEGRVRQFSMRDALDLCPPHRSATSNDLRPASFRSPVRRRARAVRAACAAEDGEAVVMRWRPLGVRRSDAVVGVRDGQFPHGPERLGAQLDRAGVVARSCTPTVPRRGAGGQEPELHCARFV